MEKDPSAGSKFRQVRRENKASLESHGISVQRMDGWMDGEWVIEFIYDFIYVFFLGVHIYAEV